MTHSTTRRRFLKQTLGGSVLVAAGGAWVPEFLLHSARATAGRATDRVLVVVQLSGGNDGLNTVVPYRDPLYRQARPTLAVPAAQVLKLDSDLGLHPSLQGLEELWQDGSLGVVQGVGYPNPNRSHFRSMDIWHSAQPENPQPRTGWLGRWLDRRGRQAQLAALHLGDEPLPLALVAREVAVPSFASLEGFRVHEQDAALSTAALRQLALSQQEPNRPTPLEAFVRRQMISALEASTRVSQALEEEPTGADYPDSPLAEKLRNIAGLIDAGLPTRIYYVSLAGFDTHVKQQGVHASLLQQWGDALRAFAQDLKARGHWNRVAVLTFSEFGRRVRENASDGTDHGTAAPVFLAGGKLRAGLHGPAPDLQDLEAGDLKFQIDFRCVYAAVLEQWLGAPAAEVLGRQFKPAKVFP